MTTTQTTKTNHYDRALTILAALAMVAAMLLTTGGPSYAASNTFTVTNTNDSGAGSLRQAILDANATTDADLIKFAIPGTGVQTIKPSTPLPPITHPVTIDGYTQKDAHPNTLAVGNDAVLKIELDGTNVPNGNGLEIDTSDGSVIRGLVINRFGVDGIFVHGDSVANRIEGNFIGTDPTGTIDKGNTADGVGIFAGPSETVIGGSTPDKRNILSGNDDDGIFMIKSNVNTIQGNYVGTDKNGTKDLGNTDGGILVQDSSGTTVGGKTAATRNVISGNDNNGLGIFTSQGTKVLGNRIGTNVGGTGALGNAFGGIFTLDVANTVIGDGTAAGSNIVAFNGLAATGNVARDGICIDSTSTSNEVSHNSIFSNGGLGIDLQGSGETISADIPTKNDAGDTDTGANNLQNKPVVSSAKTSSLKTIIKGKLDSTPNKTFTVEFFSNPTDTNEGKKFIGEAPVTTTVDGLASFTFTPSTKVPAGQTMTATATNTSTHDTSEFSAPRTVVSG